MFQVKVWGPLWHLSRLASTCHSFEVRNNPGGVGLDGPRNLAGPRPVEDTPETYDPQKMAKKNFFRTCNIFPQKVHPKRSLTHPHRPPSDQNCPKARGGKKVPMWTSSFHVTCSVPACTCTCTCTCACTCACTHVCTHACIRTCTHVHTHTPLPYFFFGGDVDKKARLRELYFGL